MKKILSLLSILSVFIICGKYYFAHQITLGLAVFCLMISVIIAFADRPIWHILKGVIVIFSFGLLLGGVGFINLIQPMLVLLIILFGMYIMVRGIFRKSNDEIDITINPKTGEVKRKDSWW